MQQFGREATVAELAQRLSERQHPAGSLDDRTEPPRVHREVLADELDHAGAHAVPVDQLVAYISRNITLLPGDIIATGTPGGVGVFRDPKVFLKPGDTVTVEVEGIGKLVNPVVRRED